jgi:hypothetical protein
MQDSKCTNEILTLHCVPAMKSVQQMKRFSSPTLSQTQFDDDVINTCKTLLLTADQSSLSYDWKEKKYISSLTEVLNLSITFQG